MQIRPRGSLWEVALRDRRVLPKKNARYRFPTNRRPLALSKGAQGQCVGSGWLCRASVSLDLPDRRQNHCRRVRKCGGIGSCWETNKQNRRTREENIRRVPGGGSGLLHLLLCSGVRMEVTWASSIFCAVPHLFISLRPGSLTHTHTRAEM